MCCQDFFACIFAAIWAFIQTVIHLILCIWGENIYKCQYTVDKASWNYIWYLTYFYRDTCVNVTLKDLVHRRIAILPNYITEAEIEEVVFPSESAYARRTYNVLMIFIILDALWLISTINLLIGTCCKIRKKWSLLLYFPWPALLLIILFLDAIATGWHIVEISLMHGIKNWFNAIGGKNYPVLEKLNVIYPELKTLVPSIYMMLIFSRLFLIWIVNLFLFFRITQASVNAFQDFNDEESLASHTLQE